MLLWGVNQVYLSSLDLERWEWPLFSPIVTPMAPRYLGWGLAFWSKMAIWGSWVHSLEVVL